MNKFKALFLTIIVVGAVVFAVSMAITENEIPKEPFARNANPEPTEVVKDTLLEEGETFLLIAEDSYLNLYNSDINGALKKSEQINFSLFPAEDIAELRKGKTFQSELEAYAAMEDFVN
ncbi:MAG: hypothetical protein UIM24_04720 [Clostridia bacterium]|nr:hypothetical protein [Clostridia bacterium]